VKKWFPCRPVCRKGKAFNITDFIVSHEMCCLAVKSAVIQEIVNAKYLQPFAALIKSEAPATSDNEHV
jgi:hypothetical protein